MQQPPGCRRNGPRLPAHGMGQQCYYKGNCSCRPHAPPPPAPKTPPGTCWSASCPPLVLPSRCTPARRRRAGGKGSRVGQRGAGTQRPAGAGAGSRGQGPLSRAWCWRHGSPPYSGPGPPPAPSVQWCPACAAATPRPCMHLDGVWVVACTQPAHVLAARRYGGPKLEYAGRFGRLRGHKICQAFVLRVQRARGCAADGGGGAGMRRMRMRAHSRRRGCPWDPAPGAAARIHAEPLHVHPQVASPLRGLLAPPVRPSCLWCWTGRSSMLTAGYC